MATTNIATSHDNSDIRNSKLSASMKARLSTGGFTPQDAGHLPPEDQESIGSSSQDDLLYDE